MKRLTTNNPSDNLSQLLNFAYADGEHVKLAYAGMRHGADLCEYISGEVGDAGLSCAPSPDDVMEGSCIECDCVFGVLNNVAIQAAELRARLMKIEDILGEDYNLEHLRELVEAERRWIPVTERMPEEHDSIFAKFHGTSRWEPCMFRTESDWVLANVVYQDGKSVVRELRTTDGGWALGHAYGVKAVTHWRPMPESVKEGA